MSKEKTYTLEEMDVIIKNHIMKNAEILRKKLQEKSRNIQEYV